MAKTSNDLRRVLPTESARRKFDAAIAALGDGRYPDRYRRMDANRRVAVADLGLRHRLIFDAETYELLDVCSHEAYNTRIFRWCRLLAGGNRPGTGNAGRN